MYSVAEDYFARWFGALVAGMVVVVLVTHAFGGDLPLWLVGAMSFIAFILATTYIVVRIVRRNRSRRDRPSEDETGDVSAR